MTGLLHVVLFRFRPETGRTHQLRVHALKGLGAPLLGDPVYGTGNAPGAKRTMLHAESLTVTRPGKTPIEARAPLLDHRPEVQPYAPGSWGPEAAKEIASPHGWLSQNSLDD